MTKRFLTVVLCLFIMMLNIMAKAVYAKDYSLMDTADKDFCNVQICLQLNTSLPDGLETNLYYQECGFNFIKEKICGCNAPPFKRNITYSPTKTYTPCKTIKGINYMDLHNIALPLKSAHFIWEGQHFIACIKETKRAHDSVGWKICGSDCLFADNIQRNDQGRNTGRLNFETWQFEGCVHQAELADKLKSISPITIS